MSLKSLKLTSIVINNFFKYLSNSSSFPQIMNFFDETSTIDFDGVSMKNKTRIQVFFHTIPIFKYCFSSLNYSDIPQTNCSVINIIGYIFFENQAAKKFHSTICVSTNDDNVVIKSFILKFLYDGS